jgi:hypothetical protein
MSKFSIFGLILIGLLLVLELVLVVPGTQTDSGKLNNPQITTIPNTEATTPGQALGLEEKPVVPKPKVSPAGVGLLEVLPVVFVAVILLGAVAFIAGNA